MKLIHRIGFFSVGLLFGIIILLFFLGGKKASCDYSPTARVLKNIKTKERDFSPDALTYFKANRLDTALISKVLESGNVNFSKSNTQGEPCNIYFIYDEIQDKTLELEVENCDSLATFQKAKFISLE